ncbi:MAG: ABC transporter substrate-binding protein [Ancrocorticia sp.]|jgi:osmoprotectant transport system substrate-binding protein|nr:ABC transporter substrate-binding protein [Ancrocorticia sp.]MCI1896275.1 ABC transporter substrate-binding protein [Ancrocorticia sp.]MCI1962670.1 ABC transporter substrate-binding protein [Ancrocorticia sp.]MCI2002049.1 ABC transporter substrate-binding protein [Ancrocorticia sp.]MCI2012465.1 ABC transporter substrate-binding protein [Ancrocorticia sp.]
MRRFRPFAAVATIAITSVALSACSSPGVSGSDQTSGSSDSSSTITVGSANFTESEILANIYAIALRDAGYDVKEKFNIGSREVYIPALEDSSIDLIPDYTGNLLSYLDSSATATAADDVDAALPAALKAKGLAMGTPAPAEDKDSIVVTEQTAKEWNLKEIGDLAAHNDELTFGGTPEFKERAVGLPGLKANYGVVPSNYVAIADGGGPATVAALVDGTVKAANIYTTSPDIPANNFVVLEDPKNNFPAQNVVPIFREGAVDSAALEVLNKVSAELTTDDLLSINAEVSGDAKMEPKAAAEQWLEDKGLINN